MELLDASAQYMSRPQDERHATLADAIAAAEGYKIRSVSKRVPFASFRAVADGAEVALLSNTSKTPVPLSNWAFGQVAARAAAPAAYLGTLSPQTAATAINEGLARRDQTDTVSALVTKRDDDRWIMRAVNGSGFARIWNVDVLKRLAALETQGWTQPVPTIRTGPDPQPYPVMLGDRDMFAFLVRDDVRIPEPGNPDGLARGVFARNSEVGAAYLELVSFLFRAICGNFIVWGASDVKRIRIRHSGQRARYSWDRSFIVEAQRLMNESGQKDAARVQSAQRYLIAGTKDEVLDKLFGRKVAARDVLAAAYVQAEKHADTDGDPKSAWGFANGLTRLSQDRGAAYADARYELDRAASKVLGLAA